MAQAGGRGALTVRRAATLLATVGGLAALAWLSLPWVAGAVLNTLGLYAGLGEARFTVNRLGWQQAALEQAHFLFRAEAGTLAVDVAQARLDYTLDWRHPVLHSVAIGQAKLTWQTSAAASAGSGGMPGAIRLALPFQRLDVARLDLDIATTLGRSAFSGALDIAEAADGGLEARLQDATQVLRLNIAPSGQQARLAAELTGGAPLLQAEAIQQPSGALHATLDADAKLLVEWLASNPLLPDRIRTQVAGLPALRQGIGSLGPKLVLTLDADRGPIRLHGHLQQAGQTLATLQASRETDGAINADLRLSAPLAVLSPLAAPLLPPPAAPWWPQAGEALGRAQLHRDGEAWSGTAYLEVNGVGLTQGALSLAGGKLRLNVTDLRAQLANFSAELPSLRVADKLEARQLAVRGHYRPDQLALEQAGMQLFGGALDIVPVELDLGRRPLALTLRLTDIDLAPLLRSLGPKDLSGAGRIGGDLPLRVSEAGLAVEGGLLTGHGPGVLRYQGPAADPNNIAFKALRNLAYHSLKAKLDYRPDGEYRIGLRLEGKNPELLAGHPVAFNLNLSGRVSELVRKGLLSGDWSRSILEEAEKQRRNEGP